jgi:uncharacterized protein (TIGR00645 family)
VNKTTKILTRFIFFSRWLQAPLYVGLVFVLCVYVYQFSIKLFELIFHANPKHEYAVMLQTLDLIDVVMLANLLIMVIVGGYETFVSHLDLKDHPDHPEWLDEVNAGTMKTKLALSLIGISSIHLLRTFIDPSLYSRETIVWQVAIHVTLLLSALAIALTNKLIGH